MTDDLNYVTIADQEWELAPSDTPSSMVGDAMFQMRTTEKIEEMERLERQYRRQVAVLKRQGISEERLPDPPERLVALIRELVVANFRAMLSCLNLAPDDSDELDDVRPTVSEFTDTVAAWYRQRNGAPMTDDDMNEVSTAVTDAYARRLEADTAIPPSRPDASASGPQGGKGAPASKRPSKRAPARQGQGSASKTSR